MVSGVWGGESGPVNVVDCKKQELTRRSATMDLAYTAMGSFDIWWEGGCWEWYVSSNPKAKRLLTSVGM